MAECQPNTKAPKLRVRSGQPGAVSSRSGSAGLGLRKAACGPVLGGLLAYPLKAADPRVTFSCDGAYVERADALQRTTHLIRRPLAASCCRDSTFLQPLCDGPQ